MGTERTNTPYDMFWNSATARNGTHVLGAIARDAAGNQRTAASVSVTLANDTTAPTVLFTSPAADAIVSGTIALAASATDDVGVVGVQFTLDGVNVGAERPAAPYVSAWNSATVANGTHVLGVVARDAAGNQRSASIRVTVANESIVPIVRFAAPMDGAPVAATVTLVAHALDDVEVGGVRFTLDGASLGTEHTAASYMLAWDTALVPNGTHMLAAVARDAVGTQETASINVSVLHLL